MLISWDKLDFCPKKCQTEIYLGSFVSSRMKENLDLFMIKIFMNWLWFIRKIYIIYAKLIIFCFYKGFKILFGVKVNLFSKRWIGHNFWRLASCNKDTSRQLGTLHFNYASIFQQGFTISVLVCSRNVLTFLGELWPCFAKCALILKGEFWTLHSVCAD